MSLYRTAPRGRFAFFGDAVSSCSPSPVGTLGPTSSSLSDPPSTSAGSEVVILSPFVPAEVKVVRRRFPPARKSSSMAAVSLSTYDTQSGRENSRNMPNIERKKQRSTYQILLCASRIDPSILQLLAKLHELQCCDTCRGELGTFHHL